MQKPLSDSDGAGNAFAVSRPNRRAGFFASRWRGDVPLATLFWRDMIIWSSLLNVAMLLVSLMLLELKYPVWLSVAAFLSPMPWNLFLVACIWRTADRQPGGLAHAARYGALVWFVAATVL